MTNPDSQTDNPQLAVNRQAGFTFIEVLVAIFILSMALTATSYLLLTNYQNAGFIKDSYIASNLAQEGMEIVRNIRDSDWHAGQTFGTSILDGTYRVQWNSSVLLPLSGNTPLLRDVATGIYSYDIGNGTNFSRTVNISTIVAGLEKKIVITVSWFSRGSRSFSVEEHLYNWR